MKWLRRIGILLLLLAAGPLMSVACGNVKLGQDWRSADSYTPAGLAPEPDEAPEAIVQVYAARAFNWRGVFAVHTWIATKPAKAPTYLIHQVMGWMAWRGSAVVQTSDTRPDRYWYGAKPELLAELRGEAASKAIPKILRAIDDYPYRDRYVVWPGPNSNTFSAFVGRQVPELALDLPVTAIGKDYLTDAALVGPAPSQTGYQLSLYGLFGLLAAKKEGVELNLLGLSFGIDPTGPAIKLPAYGRVGPR